MELTLSIGVPVLALLIVIVAAYAIWTVAAPGPKTWIDVDMGVERKPLLKHVIDCGLIYPVLFIYILFGIYSLIGWSTGSPVVLFK